MKKLLLALLATPLLFVGCSKDTLLIPEVENADAQVGSSITQQAIYYRDLRLDASYDSRSYQSNMDYINITCDDCAEESFNFQATLSDSRGYPIWSGIIECRGGWLPSIEMLVEVPKLDRSPGARTTYLPFKWTIHTITNHKIVSGVMSFPVM